MQNKKIFILLPDGVGLKNFAFSNFYKLGIELGFDITYWNNTPFDLSNLGFKEIKIQNSRSHPLTDIYKNARKLIELKLNIKKTKNKVYKDYSFPFSYSTASKTVKSILTQLIYYTHSSSFGLRNVRKKVKEKERKTLYYHQCLTTLKKEKPAVVFCTNQRPMTAIAPILAAQELGIPTATFIFSWDNLPKATMVIETDYYFVWSDFMKKELLFYYPYINESQIFISGTPQFETHFDSSLLIPKVDFFKEHNLDLNKQYVCYSGDDITTCPDDAQYLEDVAKSVIKLNKEGYNLGIVFRRCPVDFSDRFDTVLKDYKDVITAIVPLWEKIGEGWNTVLPKQQDIDLQINTIAHTEMVINLGSSMVFDYATHQKPACYVNYDVNNKKNLNWSVKKIYNYIHFQSMPNKNAVIWLNSANEIGNQIKLGLHNSASVTEYSQQWFEIINEHPAENASKRIWNGLETIISQE